MSPGATLIVVSGIAALAAALLAWFIVEAGTTGLARYRANFTERTKFQVQEFFLFIDPRSLFAANLGVMALGGILVWIVTGSLLVAVPAVVALAMLPRMLYAWMRKKRLRAFEEQLPDALMMLSGGLRAGVGLSSAIQWQRRKIA